jgi:CheY-like chemotaxis protein
MESLGILAGGIAHDFNNLLGIIIGHTSLLEIFKSDPEKITQSIEAIARAAERGADLVRQMLTFARKSDLKLESVRINDVLQDLVKFLKETLPKTIEIINDLDPQLPSVVADQNQLHSVFLNLCVNARDAMPNGGSLKIKTRLVNAEEINKFKDSLSKNYVVVDIEDTGKGMDSTTLQRIFEPFFTTKDIGKGTGLGLSVAYGVVEKHKGYIEVESEIDKGTAFHLYFPVQMQEIEITEKISESMKNVSGGNETILFVEDEDYLVESTKMILEEKGYNVLVARDGSSAIELYLKNKDKISLILSDLGLPKMDGQEVHLRIKNYNPEIKFIIASGFLEPGRKSEMLKAGVKDFILKPYKLQDMLRIIRKVIDKN